MDLSTYDFQAHINQQVMHLVESWRAIPLPEEDIQEAGNQLFNMGMIAAQQIQQEGGIQPQGAEQVIPYTLPMAERVITLFLQGLNQAVMKTYEQRLPSPEKWTFMQSVAFHVFEQGKQAVIATFGQEDTPEVQIPEEQIIAWVGQTAIEALIYYVGEHEKVNGPLARTGEAEMPDFLNDPDAYHEPEPQPEVEQAIHDFQEEQVHHEEPAPQEVYQEAVPMPEVEAPQPAPVADIPEVHYKYAAISLMLNTMPERRQRKVLASFKPEERDIIDQYRNPDMITSRMDLAKVAGYLKRFQSQMGQPTRGPKSAHASRAAGSVSKLVESLPPKRIEKIFQSERPGVRGYVRQFLNASSEGGEPFELPPGVEDGLAKYIERNFQHELEAARS